MRAFVKEVVEGTQKASYREIEEKALDANEVKVKLKSAGLNHRDIFVLGRQKENDPPLIVGSDGAGIIEEIGSAVKGINIGDEVIINPSLRWKEKSDAQPPEFEILPAKDFGTLAECIVISSDNVEPKPKYLTWEEAGVLPLSALTAYRAVFTKGNLKPNDTLLIPGIGSGTATFLLMFAKAIGARVIVTSRLKNKLDKALALGADVALHSNDDWDEVLKGEKVDVAIDSIGKATFNKSVNQLKPGGKIVSFGGTSGYDLELNLFDFFWSQKTFLGTTMGSRDEFREMLAFIEKHQIRPIIDQTYHISDTDEALKKMDEAEQFGKLAIKITD